MMEKRTRRIMKDIADFFNPEMHVEPGAVSLKGYKDDLTVVEVQIKGPTSSPFEGGMFYAQFDIPKEFPHLAPFITLQTKVWHPNVSTIGTVCMNVLDINWRAATTLLQLAQAVRELLNAPNAMSPLNAEAAQLLNQNPELYNENATMWTHVFAGGSATVPHLATKIQTLMQKGYSISAALEFASDKHWDI